MNVSELRLSPPTADEAAATGLGLLGVIRRERHGLRAAKQTGAHRLIPYRDLAALVREAPYRVPEMNRPEVLAHHQELDRAMRRWTVVPAPFGIVFPDQASVLRFLEEQHAALVGALRLLDGCWEFRLHIREQEKRGEPSLSRDVATHIYAELRRITRAAIPFPHEGQSLFSAAFLVERAATDRFLERLQELEEADPALALDTTGPWPAYDFVRIHP